MAKTNYLENKDLIEEIIKFKETGKSSEELGGMFLLLARNYSNRSWFISYTQQWKEDMVGDAVFTCLRYGKNFDPTKSNNAFAYFTRIIHHAFRYYLIKQKRHSDIKDVCFNKKDIIIEDETRQFTDKSIDYTVLKK